jgi:hypothetical protein
MIGSIVDYTLAKQDVIRRFRRGQLSRADVCDAHPELVRAASSLGQSAGDQCPICRGRELKKLCYAYGSTLRRMNGRVCTPERMKKLLETHDEFVCYEVEVCIKCHWNHLRRRFVTGRNYTGAAREGAANGELLK